MIPGPVVMLAQFPSGRTIRINAQDGKAFVRNAATMRLIDLIAPGPAPGRFPDAIRICEETADDMADIGFMDLAESYLELASRLRARLYGGDK